MSEPHRQRSALETAEAILDAGRRIVLEPEDIALLVLIRSEIETDVDEAFTLIYSAIRSLHNRLDTLQGNDARSAERRLKESLGRLEEAGCLSLSDMFRLQDSQDANYQVTAFGDALYARQLEGLSFSGEPLTAILRSFACFRPEPAVLRELLSP
jgi:hypothetical protein